MSGTTKETYTKILLELIYFYDQVRKTWPFNDLKKLDEIIELIRFWRQFES